MSLAARDPISPPLPTDGLWIGTVTAIQANYYSVQLDDSLALAAVAEQRSLDLSRQLALLCIRRGLLKKLNQQIMVGDRVAVERTRLARHARGDYDRLSAPYCSRSATDCQCGSDFAGICHSGADIDAYQLSRFLVKAESTGVVTTLCLNKRDLVTDEVANRWQQRLAGWGYQPLW